MIEKYLLGKDGYVSIPLGAKASVLCNEGLIEFWAESGPRPLLERRHVVVEHHSDKPPKGYDFVGTILKYDQIHHVFMRSRLAEIMADDAKVALAETESRGVFEGEDGIFSRPAQTGARSAIPPEQQPPLMFDYLLKDPKDTDPVKEGGPVGPGRPEGAPPVTVTLNMSQWLYEKALAFVEARLALTETSSDREALIRALCVLGAARTEPFIPCGKCGKRFSRLGVTQRAGIDPETLNEISKGLSLPPWCLECGREGPKEELVKGSELNGGDVVLLDSDGTNRCKAGAEWSVVAADRPYFSRVEGEVEQVLMMKQVLIRPDWTYLRSSKGEGTPAFLSRSTVGAKPGTKADKVGIYRCTNIEVSRNGKDWVAQFDCDQGPIIGKGLIVYGDYKTVAPAQVLLNQRHETLWLAVGTPGNYNSWSAEEPQL